MKHPTNSHSQIFWKHYMSLRMISHVSEPEGLCGEAEFGFSKPDIMFCGLKVSSDIPNKVVVP